MTITKEPFDALLEWLDPDREKAAKRYEVIRAGLIRIFVSKGLSDAEHYTDETIDRVIKRLPELQGNYVGDPVRYFHGVARNVMLEYGRRREVSTDVLPQRFTVDTVRSDTHECLSKCLKLLPHDKREFILDYHLYQGQAKILHHRQMADELKVSEGALRTRAHHLRVNLEKCVIRCIAQMRHNKTGVESHSN